MCSSDLSGLSAWAKPYISAAAANGLVSGYATVSGVSEIRGEKTITTVSYTHLDVYKRQVSNRGF